MQNYLIDTHCHAHDLETYKFAVSRNKKETIEDYTVDKMIARANQNNILQMICIGTSHADSEKAAQTVSAHKNLFWTYGIHPDEAVNPAEQEHAEQKTPWAEFKVDKNKTNIQNLTPIAIGEIGLDYRNGEGDKKVQIKLFENLLQTAKDNNLPVVFHIREAFDDFFAIMNNFPSLKAVVHSFSDSEENLIKSLDRGYYIGVNGLATFANLPTPPLERILLETDAPFLTPAPFRGKINESGHIKDIASWLSNKLGVSEAEIADVTTKNARRLFNIPHPEECTGRGNE